MARKNKVYQIKAEDRQELESLLLKLEQRLQLRINGWADTKSLGWSESWIYLVLDNQENCPSKK